VSPEGDMNDDGTLPGCLQITLFILSYVQSSQYLVEEQDQDSDGTPLAYLQIISII